MSNYYNTGIYQPIKQTTGVAEDSLGLIYRGNAICGVYIIDTEPTYYRFDTRHPITSFLPTLNLPSKVEDSSIKYERKWLSNTKLGLLQAYLQEGYRTDWVLVEILILRIITEVGTLNGLTYKEISKLFNKFSSNDLILYYMRNFDELNDLLTKVYNAVSTYDIDALYTGYTWVSGQTLLTLSDDYVYLVNSISVEKDFKAFLKGYKLAYILATLSLSRGTFLTDIHRQDQRIQAYYTGRV